MHAADPMWMRVFLGVHIAAGASSFVLAPVALATPEKDELQPPVRGVFNCL